MVLFEKGGIVMEELIRELENSLSGVLEEQLSLAVQWARQQDQQVLALTRQLAEGVASLFQPDDLARYRDACRQHWQQLLRRQWLAGFRSALGLEAVFQPDQQPPPAGPAGRRTPASAERQSEARPAGGCPESPAGLRRWRPP